MPAIVISKPDSGADDQFQAKFTFYVFVCCVMAAFGGLMFGYDIGISGGVTSMDGFLMEFFPKVHEKKQHVKENNYCKYDDLDLQLFTSSLYLAALVFTFLASYVCKKYGRRPTMVAAGIFFLVGVALNAGALNMVMLIVGRILLGIGVGFANNAVPLFISEIAPARIRGGLNILFQLLITVGILIANVVNYFTAEIHPWGWRISLGGAGVPAVLLCIGSLFVCETPTSLIQRGRLAEAKSALRRIRGTDDVEAELEEIRDACAAAAQVKQPYRQLMRRSNRPPLVIAIVLQLFQQFTGINAIMFYAPVLFQTIGFKSDASLLSAVITGTVNVLCTMVSVFSVDRVGRRALLLEAVGQMLISQVAIGVILSIYLKASNSLHHGVAIAVVILVCVYVSSFAWSWGPLGWLIPSETFPIETRAAGFSFAVSSNMIFTFIIAQSFLSMLCSMRAGIFFFFGAWIIIMGLFVIFLLPETKGIPIDEMPEVVWKQHWYWRRFMDDDQKDGKSEGV